ncbi:hypothetical protein RDI58_000024 [Solanum bulbocastanum]|uniref:DUF8018 domain-containing protein n=2 Tax=Solanum TaxID=4107 RepID=A0AAN8SFE5_SOLBU
MGIDLTTAGQNPSLSISMFAKLASFLAFMKPTLTDISSIFVDGRSGESIQLDAAYLDAVLVPRSEGKDQDIGDSESDRTFLSVGGSLPLPGPSGQASGAEFEEDHFGIDVLLESWEKSTETGTSVDQPEPEPGHVPPAIQVAPRGNEAGPSNQPPRVVPYPYQLDEVIGGDSVQSIQQRLLAKYSYTPPIGIMYLAEIEAKDLFEVKVEILRIMAVLDPTGDWLGRGARALENPRTATGEHSLDKLHTLLSDLESRGVNSESFSQLKGKDEPADPNIIYEEPDDEASSSDKDVSDATLPARRTFSIVIFLASSVRRDKREMLSISQKQISPPMLPRSAYRGIERKDPGPEQVGLGYRARVWIREGNRSDVPLTQPGNGPEGTAAWGMSASRRKAHFSLWVIRRAALSDQGPGHKGPGTIQVRRTPEVTAMSRNLTHGPKRRANTRT